MSQGILVLTLNMNVPARLVRLKWAFIGGGAAGFVIFGLAGGMLADAGWKRLHYVLAPLGIVGWLIAAFGTCLHVYDISRREL